MKINRVKIRNFRSIQLLELFLTDTAIVCGPNSCGKSNVLRALRFAFLPTFNPEKTFANFCTAISSPNAEISIEIEFDQPSSTLASAFGLPKNQKFVYVLKIKKNAKAKYQINKRTLDEGERKILLDEIVIVHVPPIRDLTAGGLDPFRATLAATIRKSRGAHSFVQLNRKVREAVKRSGHQILSSTQAAARSLLQVEGLSVDVDGIEIETLLPLAGITFKVNQIESSLDKLGTGHQSSVILSLYRQLGAATEKFVLYLFEEPDNHLHPTSLRAIADELKECITAQSQAVITTHSPYFLNQFSATDWFPLALNEDRATVSRPCRLIRNDRDLRVALGKYGLRPPEALLSKRVVIVEGPNDVTLIRELIDIHTGCSADRQDLLVIPAGGKDLVSDLCLLLDELGANWVGVMDWDAVLDTRQPNMQSGLSAADVAAVNNAIATIDGKRHKRAGTPSRLEKILDGLREELSKSSAPFQPDFSYSVLGRHLTKSKALNATEIATLKRDLKQRSMRPVRDVLTKAKLWIWSSTPEELLLNTQSAESLVESKLIEHQILKSVVQVANRKKTLVKSLHGLAHKPEILQDIIRSLHLAGEMRRR